MREHDWEPVDGTLDVSVDGGDRVSVNPRHCRRCGSVTMLDVPDRALRASFLATGCFRETSDDCDLELVRNVMES